MKTKKGFTLLELLIVIGILAILSTTIILVINPAQLLKRARDSQRISDLNTVKTAIAYYITEETGTLAIGTVYTTQTYADLAGVMCGTSGVAPAVAYTTDNSGWIPINFDGLSGGSPIGSLPADPKITAIDADPGRYYVYMVGTPASDYTFKLVANMESTMYGSGTGSVETKDGGTEATLYEVGTDMTIPIATGTATCYNGTGE